MWVVSQLVERHGGDVRAWSTSRPERTGTAISVFLPCRREMSSGAESDRAHSELVLRADGVSFLTTNS